jgi:hypothetical protein
MKEKQKTMHYYSYSIFLLVLSFLVALVDPSWKGAITCWYLIFIASIAWFLGRFSQTSWLKEWLRKFF